MLNWPNAVGLSRYISYLVRVISRSEDSAGQGSQSQRSTFPLVPYHGGTETPTVLRTGRSFWLVGLDATLPPSHAPARLVGVTTGSSVLRTGGTPIYDGDAAIWAMRPTNLNLQQVPGRATVLLPPSSELHTMLREAFL